MAKDCDLCELKHSKINEWIVGSPTGSYAILDWKAKGGNDIIIGLFLNTELTKATTEASGHGGFSDWNGDGLSEVMLMNFEEIGNNTYGTGSWGLVFHKPDYIGNGPNGIQHWTGGNTQKINVGKFNKWKQQKKLDRKPSKLENLGHYYIELVESGSDW